MANLDRPKIVALLDRLGEQDDAAVLEAARALHRMVNEADARWDELLRRDLDGDDAAALEAARALHRTVKEAGARWDELLRRDLDGDDAEEGAPDDAAAAQTSGELSEAERNEANRLIDRLLARGSLSDTLREDLGDLKEGLADGTFETMDLRYVRALAKRLGV